MAKQYNKQEVLEKLQETISRKEPIITSGAGVGLSAKCQEIGGVDLIVVYNSGKFRMNGLPSTCGNLPISDANAVVYELGEREILPIVKHVPVIAGVFGCDPTRDMKVFLPKLLELGYSGIINFPTMARVDGKYRRDLEQMGFGYAREVEMIKLANELNVLTMAYTFTPEEAVMMAEANVDILIPHAGTTLGGTVGVMDTMELEQAIALTNEIVEAALSIKPDIIPLAHGGPIATPEDVRTVLANTKVKGFVAASSIERLPVEKAIINITKEFKSINM